MLPEQDFVLAAPLAGWASKQWPADHYAELAGSLWRERGVPLLLDCAPADQPYVEKICARAPAGSCQVHVSSLDELIAATRRRGAVVGVDSGPLHPGGCARRTRGGDLRRNRPGSQRPLRGVVHGVACSGRGGVLPTRRRDPRLDVANRPRAGLEGFGECVGRLEGRLPRT